MTYPARHISIAINASPEKCAEVVFTLYRLEGVNEEEFEADAKLIEKDLSTLKVCSRLLEPKD